MVPVPELPGVRHGDVQADQVRLHVAEAGSGPPVLLLHGWPQHWWCWRELIPGLSEKYRVLVPDLRGWGWSEAPPGDYAKLTFANDIVALLDAEGIDRARVIGHDWGGYTGFLLALEHPERVERLVALDIAPPWRPALRLRHLTVPLLLSYQLLVGTPGLGPRLMTSSNAFVRAIIRGGNGRRRRWSDAELNIYADVLREPARARASSACYRTFLTREVGPMGGRYKPEDLSVPTLLITGGLSPLRLAISPQPSRNLQIKTIRGAGHFLPEEAPQEVLELASHWLTG